VFGLVEAARILSQDGFEVFPYTTEDLGVADRLVEAGCRVLVPWGAPIGSARGLNNVYGLKSLRAHFPDIPLVVDAGLGVPSHAAAAMELGYDAVLLNTAVAEAGDPVEMARAFALAVEAGRAAHLGQEDLLDADVKALRRAGLRIGVSTHDHAELEKGLAIDPDYVALGPIYPTQLKQMPWAPQGTERLAEWKRLISGRPLVAIG